MARRYVRDARGRFASKGVGGIGAYQGQTGGRGARLKTPGNTRAGGGTVAKVTQQGERKGIVSLGKKRKGLSEGQRYANTQAKAKAARQADTTKRLEAFNKKTQARLDTQTKPPSGREAMKASVRKVQNQKVRNLNKQIKEAGPNAAGLRLEKLKVQSNMSATRATPTAKQTAKSAQRNDAIRARSAELRRQAGRVNRAYANQERTADTRNRPGSSMIRRPSRKTTRGAIRAEQALKFYRDPKRALNSVNKKRPGFRMPRGMRK